VPESRPANGVQTRRLSVLVVDDDARIRRGLREMIQLAHNVGIAGEAPSPKRALELELLLQPDVVVVDVLLPRAADGLGVLAELARRGRPAIAISVCAPLGQGALAAGAHIFLAKGPQLIDGLLPAIRTAALSAP
jgi:DNA-binding NarL/FixJ family response regulator